jgi:hypothetical protein
MAIKVDYKFRSHGITWKSGYLYKFRYNAYRNDPTPLVILMGRYLGRHPNTGHQWRLIQCINLNYIPRSHRKLFAMQWKNHMEASNNVVFTWNKVKRQFPYLRFGIRRYVLKPVYRIQNLIEIPFDDMEDAIIDTWDKDFSKKVKIDMAQKFKRIQKFTKLHKKKVAKGLRSMFGGFFGRR